jgi:hypothetical protein
VLYAKLKGAGVNGSSWVACWRCGVLFTDDSARAEALRVRCALGSLRAQRLALFSVQVHGRRLVLRPANHPKITSLHVQPCRPRRASELLLRSHR